MAPVYARHHCLGSRQDKHSPARDCSAQGYGCGNNHFHSKNKNGNIVLLAKSRYSLFVIVNM